MYKVMLVDDDVPMLKYLRKMINWNALEMEAPITTYSAVKALQLFRENLPDIVVMDIGIPQINGLDLVEKFQEVKPDVRVIFLTCHESFSFAKRALELEADGYLIKDELTAKTFENSLKSALQSYKESQEENGIKYFQGVINKSREMLKRSYLEQILNGNVKQNHDISKIIGIRWQYPDFIVGISSIDYAELTKRFNAKEIPLIMYGIWNVAEELAKDFEGMTSLADQDKRLYLIFNFKQNISRKIFDEYDQYLKRLQKVIFQYWKVNLSFLFSKNIVPISEIGSEILQLKKNYESYFYYEKNIEIFPDHQSKKQALNSNELLKPFENKIMKAFEGRSGFKVNEVIDKLEGFCKEKYILPGKLKENCIRWIHLFEINVGNTAVSGTFTHYMRESTKLSEVITLLRRKVAELIHDTDLEELDPNESSRMQMIDQYILNHLSENIYSADVAHHLYLNPSYFSRHFKDINGENFTDYVHRFKMKIAVKLMRENKESIKVIASRLGYSDRSYFSKIFKKYIGHSPGEYRTKKKNLMSV